MPAPKKTPQPEKVLTEPLLIPIPEAARRLSATIWAVRELLWAKKVRYIKLGRRFLIDPADLRAFIEREKGRAA